MQENGASHLYTCESRVNAYEYKRMAIHFPEIYWNYVKRLTLLNFLLSAGVFSNRSFVETLIFFCACQAFILVYCRKRLEHYAEKRFCELQKNRGGKMDYTLLLEFYDTYLVTRGESTIRKVNYSDIIRCVETDTHFYLKYRDQTCVMIQKDRCEPGLIFFMREAFAGVIYHPANPSERKGRTDDNYRVLVNYGMMILFILVIASLWGAGYSIPLINRFIPRHGINENKNMWVFWCWLPIPILSIILGFKYKKAGFRCTKNIVAGFIVSFLMAALGALSLLPVPMQDYHLIDPYRTILDVEIPDQGELILLDKGIVLGENDDMKGERIINVFYAAKDIAGLAESIEQNPHWTPSREIRSELKIFLPFQFVADEDTYCSIYNKTTEQYNELPKRAGVYEICVMKYDRSDRHLQIYEFKYSFR